MLNRYLFSLTLRFIDQKYSHSQLCASEILMGKYTDLPISEQLTPFELLLHMAKTQLVL